MSVARFAAVTAAVLIVSTATAGAGGPQRPFQHGFWSGGAYTDDRTGAFTHCSAGAAYDSGINLFFLITEKYQWWLGFISSSWSFSPNAKTPIRLRLDGEPALDRLATIPNGQLILVPLPDSSHLIDTLRRSVQLTVETEGHSFSLKLNETSAVMDRLMACVRTAVALADRTTPAQTAVAAPTADGAEQSTKSPADVPTAEQSASHAPVFAIVPSPDAPLSPPSGGPPAASSSAAAPPPLPMSTAAADSPSATPQRPGDGPTGARTGPAPAAAVAVDPVIAPERSLPATTTAPTATTAQTPPPLSGSPHLAFTAVSMPPEPAPAAAREEVRLAADFLVRAQLPDAHLVAADKPAALADFTAVWRAEDAAGAVKIIPSAPGISAISIASNLIAVDPQVCRGDFTSARFRSMVGDHPVFSAVLSCSDAGGQRLTEYIVAPRRQGGFVVFAVIRSNQTTQTRDFDRQKLDALSRAAIEAAGGQG